MATCVVGNGSEQEFPLSSQCKVCAVYIGISLEHVLEMAIVKNALQTAACTPQTHVLF